MTRLVEHVSASAPAKVILIGEHAVNRGYAALATAIDLRIRCDVRRRADDTIVFRSAGGEERGDLDTLTRFGAEVDALRASGDIPAVGAYARTYFAPTRYALSGLARHGTIPGLDVEWTSGVPVGAGFGSGAAASAALLCAVAEAAGIALRASEIAGLAARGDVIAHGGVASGLDAGAIALGGATRYSVADGPRRVRSAGRMRIVIADTGISADTATVNNRLRGALARDDGGDRLFAEIGALVPPAIDALERGEIELLGSLMTRNQRALERLGVSCPEIATLVDAALAGGAFGAKLSGSGGGGIVIALAPDDRVAAVGDAMRPHASRVLVVDAAAHGVGIDLAPTAISHTVTTGRSEAP